MEPQLQVHEIAAVRKLRQVDELTFEQIGERLGIDMSTAYRIVAKPGYQFSDLLLIRIRKALIRLADEEPSTASKPAGKRRTA